MEHTFERDTADEEAGKNDAVREKLINVENWLEYDQSRVDMDE